MTDTLDIASRGTDASSPVTPAMRQWAEQKAQVPDAVLLFRIGDFYETFHDDARTVSRVLGIALTSRNKGDANPIPLAGIPYHALDNYLAKLVRAGLKVALSEQVEDPAQAKGVVRREIVRVITPGTLTDDNLLEETRSNYLAALCTATASAGPRGGGGHPPLNPEMACACLDLASGDFFTLAGEAETMINELVRLGPAEVLVTEDAGAVEKGLLQRVVDLTHARVARRPPHEFDRYHAQRSLHQHFGVSTLEGFGYAEEEDSLRPAGAILAYLKETQKTISAHVTRLQRREWSRHVQIDPWSWRSLEVERTLRSARPEGTLLAAVDRTCGAMGARRLREWLRFPLRSAENITARQEAVAELMEDANRLKNLRQLIREVSDIERITARLGLGRCSPRDLSGLGRSLVRIGEVQNAAGQAQSGLLSELIQQLGGLEDLGTHLQRAIRADAPLTVREGGIFAAGFNAELDRLRDIGGGGQRWLAEYQAAQIQSTGIPSLRVGFNRVFGYYIEITHTHRDLVPPNYVRRQTVKNAERYITEELKAHETEVLGAQDRANELEYRLFEELKTFAARRTADLLRTAGAVGTLDVLASFASLASERGYVRPQVCQENLLEIVDGRHPALEAEAGRQFVPNDAHIGEEDARLLIITGPNMAGKSTYIRQVALLTLLAQTGSFVPAASMRWKPVDRLFARVGAGDELAQGQSTFMVEMIEAANILNNATADSLVILDELGRGTSTYDGLSLAWAICEHICTKLRCRTLFATHYHELTELARLLPGVKNYNVAVREQPSARSEAEKIVFLHKIVEGGTDRSYGVHVARMAGIPPAVIERSRQVLRHLESGLSRSSLRDLLAGRSTSPVQQLELFTAQDDRLRHALLEIDINQLTPLQALETLKRLQDEAI